MTSDLSSFDIRLLQRESLRVWYHVLYRFVNSWVFVFLSSCAVKFTRHTTCEHVCVSVFVLATVSVSTISRSFFGAEWVKVDGDCVVGSVVVSKAEESVDIVLFATCVAANTRSLPGRLLSRLPVILCAWKRIVAGFVCKGKLLSIQCNFESKSKSGE